MPQRRYLKNLVILASILLTSSACSEQKLPIDLVIEGKEKFDPSHDYTKDYIAPPPSTNYIKIAASGFTVNKSFPIIFISDRKIVTNRSTREVNFVVRRSAMVSMISITDSHCSRFPKGKSEEDLVDQVHSERLEGVIVSYKLANNNPNRCLFPAGAYCDYLMEIGLVENKVIPLPQNIYLGEFSRAVKCGES